MMAHIEEKVEGIVLKHMPFKETDRIISLLTPDRGIISLYVKGACKKNPFLINLTSPLCRGEFVFRRSRSDLYRFIDGTIFDLHLPVRRSFFAIQYVGKMIEGLMKTQMPGKRAYGIYRLFLAYLKHLPKTAYPETLWASFGLKLLKYEGLLAIEPFCISCHNEKASCINRGESRCKGCNNLKRRDLSSLEWSALTLLIEARTFDLLLKTQLSPFLIEEINCLFISQFHLK